MKNNMIHVVKKMKFKDIGIVENAPVAIE